MPDEALLRAVMVKLFADRQLAVDEALIGYPAAADRALLRRRPRCGGYAGPEALQQGRPVNRTLAAELYRKGIVLNLRPNTGGQSPGGHECHLL